jgi:predicted transcriptional regulator
VVNEGTDSLAIEIQNDVLYIMTNVGFESASAKRAEFEVVSNSDETVLAVTSEGERTVDVFTLDKTTGMAVWTKTRSEDLIFGSPTAQSFLLTCQ